MTSPTSFRPQERVRQIDAELARFVSSSEYADLPASVCERMPLVLVDLAGVTVAGMRTPELQALVEAWSCPAGDTAVPGTDTLTTPETSAYLAAVGACCLELDEGNKYAADHPAAHVVFAAAAAARTARHPVSGEAFLTAVALG